MDTPTNAANGAPQGSAIEIDPLNIIHEYFPMQMEDVKMIGLSFALWTSMYLVVAYSPLPFKPKGVNLKRLDDLDVRNRIVSFTHGFLLMVLAGYEFYFLRGSCGDRNSQYQKNLMYMSIGYFIYDFGAMCYYGLVDFAMTFHHTICVVGMATPLVQDVSGNYIVMGMYVAEVSNFLMHIRIILKHYGLRYTKAYETAEIGFMMLYIYGRMLVGPAIVWSTITCASNNFVVRFCSLGLFGQSVFFVA